MLATVWPVKENALFEAARKVGEPSAIPRRGKHISPLRFAPGLAPPFYTWPPATSVVLASVSFYLVFLPNTLGTRNAGEEEILNVTRIIRATYCGVNFYLFPANDFCLCNNPN